MRRPILVAVIGYIIGIIMGLYFKNSIVLFYICFIPIIAIFIIKNKFKSNKKFKLFSFNRYFRYIKIFLNSKVILTIILSSIISNTIVLYKNNKYKRIYETSENIELTAIVVSNREEKEYKNIYKIKVEEINKASTDKSNISINNKYNKNIANENIFLYLTTNKKIELKYADKVFIKGKYQEPDSARNYGGFDYSLYLKTLNIYGTVNGENIKVIKQNSIDELQIKINSFRKEIKNNIKEVLDNKTYPIYFSLILADSSYIEDDIRENFTNSSMSHILAVSGMHISYIIIGVSFLLNKILGKRTGKIITAIVIIVYSVITGFTTSLARASIMGVMFLLSNLLYRKNDTWTSISLSLLIILVYNPYLLTNIGLQYSYVATVGIIIFSKNILKFLNKKDEKRKKIKEIISISLSAQIALFPLILFHTNKFGIYFLITNFLISFIIGPIIILGFAFLIICIFSVSLAKVLSPVINLSIQLVLIFSKIGEFPLSKIHTRTPKIYEILIYYIVILLINFFYKVKTDKTPKFSILRVKWIIAHIKYKLRIKGKKYLKSTLVITVVFTLLVFIGKPKKLQINLVDVGQGDCIFIITPENKTILIDGGGSEFGSFDVGKNTLLTYILDKGYTSIDYVLISHFDSDHVRRNFVYIARN